MTMIEAVQIWNAGHRHPGTTFRTQAEAQVYVIEMLRSDPVLLDACQAALARIGEIVSARLHPSGTHGCVITADRQKTLTAMLAAAQETV